MAYALPDSHFVGIDNSSAHISEGQVMVMALALPNISLKQMSIADVTETLGQFDYIIAHGVYSWVPPVIRDKLLAICRQNLAPNGVAYISYNTYPGWNM
jgi:cyclopropane fatty-acyl-phospholipid synthase-like methyltransferase